METDSKFLSQIANSPKHKSSMINMLTQVMNDLNTNKMCILTGAYQVSETNISGKSSRIRISVYLNHTLFQKARVLLLI